MNVRQLDLILISLLMILFGIAEVATGVTGNFVNLLTLTTSAITIYSAATVGIIYAIGGLFLITAEKRNAGHALTCLYLVIIGRVLLVLTGIYPLNSTLQIIGIIVGTGIAALFAIYIRKRLKKWE